MGLEKGTRAGCTAKPAAAREGCKLQPPAFLPFCFPFWEVGKGVYWLVRLVHLWRVEQRQDFRLYVDSIPELAHLKDFLTLPPTPSSASSLSFHALPLQ
jgi:hypothetical protein